MRINQTNKRLLNIKYQIMECSYKHMKGLWGKRTVQKNQKHICLPIAISIFRTLQKVKNKNKIIILMINSCTSYSLSVISPGQIIGTMQSVACVTHLNKERQ